MAKALEILRDDEQFSEIYSRIHQAAKARTQVELANKLGIRQSSISDAKKNSRIPASWVLSLFMEEGWNPKWLIHGEYPKNLYAYDDTDEDGISANDSSVIGPAGGRLVNIYSCEGDMANGVWTSKPLGQMLVQKSQDRPNLLVVQVSDSSMEPGIRRKALVGLDRERTDICEGDVYGVFVPGKGIVLKRIFLDIGNEMLLLRADNPEYPENTMPVMQKGEKIVGKASWVLQEL